MSDRCEPPEHLRGVDGWWWVKNVRFPGVWPVPAKWESNANAWIESWMPFDPANAYERGWRVVAPVPSPEAVRVLVGAGREAIACLCKSRHIPDWSLADRLATALAAFPEDKAHD